MALFKYIRRDHREVDGEWIPCCVGVVIDASKITKTEYCPDKGTIDIYIGKELYDTVFSDDAKALRKVHFEIMDAMQGMSSTSDVEENRSLNLSELKC